MTKLFSLEPEVAGELGPAMVIENEMCLASGSEIIPEITDLEYIIEGWLGDALLTTASVYMVTEELANNLVAAKITGMEVGSVKMSVSDEWQHWRSEITLPRFQRLIPLGKAEIRNDKIVQWSGHDICFAIRTDFVKPMRPELTMSTPPPYTLVVSERCLGVLRQHQIDNCDIEEIEVRLE